MTQQEGTPHTDNHEASNLQRRFKMLKQELHEKEKNVQEAVCMLSDMRDLFKRSQQERDQALEDFERVQRQIDVSVEVPISREESMQSREEGGWLDSDDDVQALLEEVRHDPSHINNLASSIKQILLTNRDRLIRVFRKNNILGGSSQRLARRNIAQYLEKKV